MPMPTDIGIVDLGMGFPYQSIEEKKRTYDFFRANLKDKQSLEEMEFPAQYMFKQVPDVVSPDTDPVQFIVDKMDQFGIEIAKVGLSPNGIRARQMYPERFTNVTNGITVRRWLKQSNTRLARLLTERLGSAWENDLEEIERLRWAADDPAFRAQFREIKRANKMALAEGIDRRTGIDVSVDSLFDVHVKRIHEYKRQLLNILYVITRYNRIKARPDEHWVPRTVMFAGKAAPGYAMAKGIIRLINNVSTTINQDPATLTKLKCVFLPDYDVSLAQTIMPAADLSQQISTAGMEASGTGNMKLALNGALTIGTLDGANIEIRDSVGPENIFIFGMTADEAAVRQANGYRPREIVAANPELAATLEMIRSGAFNRGGSDDARMVVDRLTSDGEPFLVLADFAAYCEAQDQVDALYRQPEEWSRRAVLNTVGMGPFSSDRSVREYAERIWNIRSVI